MKRKRAIKKIAILLVLFLLVGAGILFMMNKTDTPNEATEIALEQANLPVLVPEISGKEMNTLLGYTGEVDLSGMRDTITPLPSNRQLKIKVTTNNTSLSEIHYEIRSLDGQRLIENTLLKDWKEKNGEITLTLPIQNLLDEKEEYQLVVYLKDKQDREIKYYTRIVESTNLETKNMIDFVENLHNKILAGDNSLAAYLKKTTADTQTFASVSLNSTFKQLTWGSLSPKETGTNKLYLTDINSSIAVFRLDSTVEYKDDNGVKQMLTVQESFCVQYIYSNWYVLSYERNTSQNFTGSSDQINNQQIKLGIQKEGAVESIQSEDGSYQAFSLNGELWMYGASTSKLTRVFSFKAKKADVRTDYNGHDIKLVNVDEKGNVDFAVYGYMNRGTHEGEVGLAFYHYNHEKSRLEEIFYLSYNKSFEMLEQQMGKLCYINDSNVLYLMLNQKIYAIDFEGNEAVKIVDHITDDKISISSDGSAVAWQEDSSSNGANVIQILYMDTGKQNTLTAKKGENLKNLGFVDKDFVYGVVKESDINRVDASCEVPMYKLVVTNTTGEDVATYQKDKLYISGISIQSGSITINLVKIQSDGTLKDKDSDILIQNEKTQNSIAETLVSETSETCLTKWYITASGDNYDGNYQSVDKILLENNKGLVIDINDETEDKSYYSYALGKLVGMYSSVSEAIEASYIDVGCVTDQNGLYVFRRGYRDYISLDIPLKEAKDESASLEACLESMIDFKNGSLDVSASLKKSMTAEEILTKALDGRVYDLSGATLSEVVYYCLWQNAPILAKTQNGYVLIVGINGESVTWYDPINKEKTTQNLSDAESYFKKAGKEYLVYMD